MEPMSLNQFDYHAAGLGKVFSARLCGLCVCVYFPPLVFSLATNRISRVGCWMFPLISLCSMFFAVKSLPENKKRGILADASWC